MHLIEIDLSIDGSTAFSRVGFLTEIIVRVRDSHNLSFQNQGVPGVVKPVTIRAASPQLEHGAASVTPNAPHP